MVVFIISVVLVLSLLGQHAISAAWSSLSSRVGSKLHRSSVASALVTTRCGMKPNFSPERSAQSFTTLGLIDRMLLVRSSFAFFASASATMSASLCSASGAHVGATKHARSNALTISRESWTSSLVSVTSWYGEVGSRHSCAHQASRSNSSSSSGVSRPGLVLRAYSAGLIPLMRVVWYPLAANSRATVGETATCRRSSSASAVCSLRGVGFFSSVVSNRITAPSRLLVPLLLCLP